MRILGFEPKTTRLKVYCSTTELYTLFKIKYIFFISIDVYMYIITKISTEKMGFEPMTYTTIRFNLAN